MRMLIFGDSITQGFFDQQGGWANRVRMHYDSIVITKKDYEQPMVFNLGISGEKTSGLLKRIEPEIIARQWPNEELVILIAIGTNDTVFRNQENDLEPEIFTKQIQDLHNIAIKYSKKIFFVGFFPVEDNLLNPMPWSTTGKCYSTERMQLFNKALEDFCKNNEYNFIDLWNVFSEQLDLHDLMFDGIHPNNKGHELIAKKVISEIDYLTK